MKKIIPSLWKPHARNLKQKKEKRKENFYIKHHIGISVKKLFLYCTTFLCFGPSASKSIWLSSSIILFCFILFVLNQMLYFYLNYERRNLCNVSGNVCVKFISCEIDSL